MFRIVWQRNCFECIVLPLPMVNVLPLTSHKNWKNRNKKQIAKTETSSSKAETLVFWFCDSLYAIWCGTNTTHKADRNSGYSQAILYRYDGIWYIEKWLLSMDCFVAWLRFKCSARWDAFFFCLWAVWASISVPPAIAPSLSLFVVVWAANSGVTNNYIYLSVYTVHCTLYRYEHIHKYIYSVMLKEASAAKVH